jgi:ribose-phosphate pyrophosphokinase
MIRTGGSLIAAGRAYRDAGATKLAAITTHGLLPGDALERLEGAGLFDKVIATDSHPRAKALADHRFLEVWPCAEVFLPHLSLRQRPG